MDASVTVLCKVALVLAWAFSVGGLLFALGYAFEDPGGWAAVGLAAAVVVPLGGLTVLGLRAPRLGFVVLTTAVALFAGWALVDALVEVIDLPSVPMVALVLAAPIAVLGQRQPMRAGWLMLATAAVPLALVVVRLVQEGGVEGPGIGDLLTTSTGVVIVPLVVIAAMLLAAGVLTRRARTDEDHPSQTSPATPALPR